MRSIRAFGQALPRRLSAFQPGTVQQRLRPVISIGRYSTAAAMADKQSDPCTSHETSDPCDGTPPGAPETTLPKLSPQEFRQYNRMADMMNYYHNHFRSTWTMMMDACENNKRPKNMTIKQFIGAGLQFCQHLTMHHTIEEQHVFPALAKKMPKFRKELELLTQHKQIHEGVVRLEDYLEKCRSGETELRLAELKEVLDSWGTVLWQHLDEEVDELKAENMRKYWSLDEMRKLPM